ncbi:MAG: hypothetical protein ABJG15_01700 [Hyphomonadaceae bacterium]
MKYATDDLDIPAGTIVSIPYAQVLRHYGVVTARGTVISNSRAGGGVIEQSLGEFKNGHRLREHGGADARQAYKIEARARRALGSPYDLTGSNCIDFTRHTHKRRPTVWQFGRAMLMAAGDMSKRRR